MVSLSHIEEQLKGIGCNFRFWGRSEIKELANVLVPGEIIARCVNGRYQGGFAMLCVTDRRLLLIDKKPMFLSLEDIRFDMIVEIDYNAHLLTGGVHISTPVRKLIFTSWSQRHLRELLNYTQHRVMEIRQHYMMQQFQQNVFPQVPTPVVEGLAVETNTPAIHQVSMPMNMNPYTKMPLLQRRRRYPKFY